MVTRGGIGGGGGLSLKVTLLLRKQRAYPFGMLTTDCAFLSDGPKWKILSAQNGADISWEDEVEEGFLVLMIFEQGANEHFM